LSIENGVATGKNHKKIVLYIIYYKGVLKGVIIITTIVPIIIILIIVFFLTCLECILRKRVSYIVSTINDDSEIIESRIRELIFLNPKSEIVVLCTPWNPETLTILEKLSDEYSQLHIIK